MHYIGNIRGCLEKYGDFAGAQQWILKASKELAQDRFRAFSKEFCAYLSNDGARFAERGYAILAPFDPESVADSLLASGLALRNNQILTAIAQTNGDCVAKVRDAIAARIAAIEEQRRLESERVAEAARQEAMRGEEAQRRAAEEQRVREVSAQRLKAQRDEAGRDTIQRREEEKQRQIGILRQYHVEYLAHITHIDNLEGILRNDLWARNRVPPQFVDIADVDVNARRVRIESVYRRSIQDYVPFYFNPVNPMLSKRRDCIRDLTILRVAAAEIVHSDRHWVLSDGNAAAGATRFYGTVDALEKLDWNCLRAAYWTDIPDGKRKRCAEVLIETQVPASWIVEVECFSRATMARATALIAERGAIRVVCGANPFP